VNGRFVRDLVLRRALGAAYAGIVPKDRYPLVILDVRLPPGDVDVNVHPAKTEVRFAHGFELQNAVTQGLRAALQDYGIQRPVQATPRYTPSPAPVPTQVRLPGAEERPAEATAFAAEALGGWRPGPAPSPGPPLADARPADPPLGPDAPLPAPPALQPAFGPVPPGKPPPRATSPNRPLLPVSRFADLRVIGQLKRTYLLCEGAGELVIIDQHAAAERVTLYKLTCDRASVVGGAQQLLTPRMVRLGASRARALAPEVESLLVWGLDVRFMGGDTFAVHSLPGPLARADLDVLLGDVADEVASGAPASMPQERLEHFLNTLACHTSIRAGDLLSHDDIARLLRDLDAVDFSVCAHGRPIAIWIGPEELERRFHR